MPPQIALEGNIRRNGLSSKSDVAKNPVRAKGDTYDDDDDDDAYLPPDMTRKILEQARQQRDEMEEEETDGASGAVERTGRSGTSLGTPAVGDPVRVACSAERFTSTCYLRYEGRICPRLRDHLHLNVVVCNSWFSR